MVPMARRLLPPLLTALLLAACGGSAATPAAESGSTPAANATAAALLPTTADALPDMDLAGFEALLGQVRGTPLVVNVWASWCGPCREEAPVIAAAVADHPEVQFLGIDILDTRASAREFIVEQGWTHPNVFDGPGAIRDGLGLLGQPVTLFYAADGTLVSSYTGAIPADELDRRIGDLVVA